LKEHGIVGDMTNGESQSREMSEVISEDVLPAQPAEEEDEDETGVDFGRLLAAKGYGSTNGPSKIPSRGLKDFEPHGTEQQQTALQKSRDAMYTVLRQERIHKPDSERAVWDPKDNGAWVLVIGGKWSTGVGRGRRVQEDLVDESGKPISINRQYLYPEEALWLLERGSLDIRWPASAGKEEGEGLPMSLQAAHAVFIGSKTQWLTPERYVVYQYLKRAGYNVFRADDNWQSVPENATAPKSLWSIIFNVWSFSSSRGFTVPLVRPASYRNYREYYFTLLLYLFD
jgi:tRNA-splicing endonuclease subunit Sen54